MLRSSFRSIQEIPITAGLVVIHSILFFLTWIASGSPLVQGPSQGLFDLFWQFMPISNDVLRTYGSQSSALIWKGEYHRLFFSAFLHGTFAHFFFNNLNLYFLGQILENLLGSKRFFLMYMLALFAGNVASLLWIHPMIYSVGASGAIMGIVGVLVIFLLFDQKERFLSIKPSGRYMFFLLVGLTLVLGELFPMINNTAHIFGFLAGLLFGLAFWSQIPGEKIPKWLGYPAFLALIIGIGGMTYQGINPDRNQNGQLYRALRHFQKGESVLAEKALKKTLDIGKSSIAEQYLGELYTQTKQWSKAATFYQRATETHPQQFHYWFSLLTALRESKQDKKAQEVFLIAKTRFLDAKKKTNGLLSFFQSPSKDFDLDLRLAMLLTANYQERKALRIYQELLRDYPQASEVRNNLAWLLVTAHDSKALNPKLALQHAKTALRNAPYKSAAHLDTLATIYFRLKKYSLAIKTIKQAEKSRDAQIWMPHLLLQQKKFHDEAKKHQKKGKKPSSRPTTSPSSK